MGKASMVLIVLCSVVGGVAATSSNEWVKGGAILGMILVVSQLLSRLIDFAKTHPQAAILEGAEFLRHEQITMASKADPQIIASVNSQVIGRAVRIPPEAIQALNQPDTAPPPPETPDKNK